MSETNVIKSNPHPTRTSKGLPQRQEPKIEYNDRDVTAYTDLGLELPETVGRWEKRFLSMVDVSRGPTERSVIAMVRLKAPDYLGYQSAKNSFITRKSGTARTIEVFH